MKKPPWASTREQIWGRLGAIVLVVRAGYCGAWLGVVGLEWVQWDRVRCWRAGVHALKSVGWYEARLGAGGLE